MILFKFGKSSIIYTMLCTSMCTDIIIRTSFVVRCNQATTPCLDKNLQYQSLCEIVQNRSLQEDACKDSMYAVYTVNVWAHTWLQISILIQGSLSPCANLQSVSLHSPRAKARHIASENWHRQVLHLDFN